VLRASLKCAKDDSVKIESRSKNSLEPAIDSGLFSNNKKG
jgi:hypothetical protein